MASPGAFKVIRDPVWNNIQLDREALDVLDSPPFQRLRYIRQLGHAFLVYPGATHTRFEHALGTYHLARRALDILASRGELVTIPDHEQTAVRLAALLHDIGHYPFSHALEEAGLPSHETMARTHFQHPELRAVLDRSGIPAIANQLSQLISGTGGGPLGGLISGPLDLDKIEYLTRDARMTGVPYGAVDVDRLLHALTVVQMPDGSVAVGVRDKGVSALESLVFARYQMYRNVYWHHAVRSATAMFKRVVRIAIAEDAVTAEWIATTTDEALMERLRSLRDTTLADRLRNRVLYKRIIEVRGDQVPTQADEWIAHHPDLVEAVENRIANELGLAPGALLLDFPAKAHMLETDLPVLTAHGTVEPLSGPESGERFGLQSVAQELYAGARHFRLFAVEPVDVDIRRVLEVLEHTKGEITADLQAGRTLVG
jgi:hypothetical protein